MSRLLNVVRDDVRALAAYHVPDASGLVKLDAMENPYTLPPELQQQLGERLGAVAMNRYPVPSYAELKAAIRTHMAIPAGFDVILGNGSDELIAIVSTACAKPGAKVLAPVPGFVMYAMSAQLAGMAFIGVPVRADFSLDLEAMLATIRAQRPAITYLAYPNNPTGNLFDLDDMLAIIREVGDTGLVIVDEAYQPFAGTSFLPRLPEFPNAPAMTEFASGADRLLMEIYASTGTIGRSLAYPPGVPADRVNAMRQAFQKMLADPVFIAETKKGGVIVTPMSGEELSAEIVRVMKTPKEQVDAARQIHEDLLKSTRQ